MTPSPFLQQIFLMGMCSFLREYILLYFAIISSSIKEILLKITKFFRIYLYTCPELLGKKRIVCNTNDPLKCLYYLYSKN
jgi:hypothetical protein